jgi:hypothetical protein
MPALPPGSAGFLLPAPLSGHRARVALILVLTDHVVMPITGRSPVETPVAERPELPVAIVIILGQLLGDDVDERLQTQWKMHAEELLRDGQSLTCQRMHWGSQPVCIPPAISHLPVRTRSPISATISIIACGSS